MTGEFCTGPEYWERQVKRYLYARLDGEWRSDPSRAREHISRFLAALSLAEGDLSWLARVYHVLQTRGAYEFVTQTLRDSISSLSRERWSRVAVNKGKVRGRILWEKTVRLQVARADHSVYATEECSKTPDTPENRLLKKYLQSLTDCRLPLEGGGATSAARKTSEVLRVANELVGSVFLRDVSPVPQVTARMLARARRNKHPIYAKVAELWAEFEASVVRQDLDAIKEILARGWLGPRMTEDTDSLFQLYVLVCVLEALEDVILQGQGSAKFGLIRSEGAAAVAVYEGPAWKAEVFYDKAPSTALGFHGGGSFYIRMMELFRGLSGAPRRPDVSVRLTGGRGGEVRLIVEAKNTDPASRYGGDSVYKAFGYLRDYEGLWRQDQHPKIVLAYPRGTAPTSQSSFTAEDLAIISGDLRAQFKTILTHLIGASD